LTIINKHTTLFARTPLGNSCIVVNIAITIVIIFPSKTPTTTRPKSQQLSLLITADPSGMAQQSSTAFLLLHHQNEAMENAAACALRAGLVEAI